MKKVYLLLLCLFLGCFSKQQQCIVCICEKENNEIVINYPICNFENPKLSIHKFTEKTLSDAEAENLCKNYCRKKGHQYKQTKIWQCKSN